MPENIRNAVLNGKMKPADAAQQVQNLVTFQTLLAKSVAAGNDVPENIKQAVMAGKTKPKDAVNQMVSGMVETANAGKPKMKTSGKEISAGFEDGINSKQKSVESAGKNLASSGRSGAKSQSSCCLLYTSGSGMQYQKIRSLHMTSENSIKIQLGAK